MRINLSQAFNGIGAVMAPTLGSYVIFTFSDEAAIQNVQWIYLAIAIFVFALAFVFFLSVIPEITDADMDFQAKETHGANDDKPLWKQWRLWHAAFAQFCYNGAQVSVAAYFINYAQDTRAGTSASTAAQFYAGAQGCFAFGRFVGVGLMYLAKPRWIFLLYVLLCFVFLAPSITASGNTGIALLCVTLFFESIQFPTIVALGMRGLGRHTKRGSGWIIAGVIGAATFPPLTGYVIDTRSSNLAMVVPLMAFLGPLSYAVVVNFVPYYRNVVDAFESSDVGVSGHHDVGVERGNGVVDEESGGDPALDVGDEKGVPVEKQIS
jgi:MFS transporter, FHS family, L-fucose permease